MYYGQVTEELNKVRYEYEDMFGYDPNGEMEIVFGEDEYNEYLKTLKKCVETKKDMFEVLDL